MYQDWWNDDQNRVSSAAVSFPCFSVDIVSISGSEENTLKPFLPGTGLAIFNCGDARQLGCTTRHEPDEENPENKAHAHTYLLGENKDRKKIAKRLATICRIVRKPNLTT